MGRLKLLSGQFNGKVGSFVGSKNHSGHYVKARVFSKAPATTQQIANLTAFGALQRFTAALAKHTKNYRFLTTSTQTWYNTLTSTFKSTLVNNSFVVDKVVNSLPQVDSATISIAALNLQAGSLALEISAPETLIEKSTRVLLFVVYNENEKEVDWTVTDCTAKSVTFSWDCSILTSGFVFAVEIVQTNKIRTFSSGFLHAHPYSWRNPAVIYLTEE